ncbi:hypothetical protein [Desulfobulbus oligotrophicus]|uniref:Uncharacterized protein n=1 Tax=Desulfobulbus oligotrophicus TaxID=1909699 RepID=A0A7T6ARB1_9BACT|nr:hypothetical protein [Desulfobulbus oligotrophicus]QQG66367.1 hypothetical protein HP555_11050 [Desulfobulbus oligotrophicus]
MADIGTLNPLSLVPLAGLSARSTNHAAQCYIIDEAAVRDVGYVTKDKRVVVWLWNGSATDANLTRINGNGEQADGIGWDATPPDLLIQGTSQRIVITVTIDGPLEYEALLTFLSSCAHSPTLTIIGTRAPHLSGDIAYLLMPHNWENGLDESLAWKTDVLVAHDRTEQRIQLRTLPRRAWDLRLVVAGAARRKLETWLGLRKTRYLFSPVWRDEARITAAIVAGASIVQVGTGYLDFAVGRWLVVYDAWDHFEIRTITGIGINYVAVDAPFAEEWPEGSLVAPCRYGIGIEQRRVSRFTESVGDYRIRFEARDESAMPAIATPDTYRDLVVCPFVPSWTGGEETWDNKWVRLDNDTGVIEFDIQAIEPVLSRAAQFRLIGRVGIDTFLRFLFYCAGRLSPFWLAATDRGFELALPAPAGATAITIGNIGYEYAFSGSPAREHIEMIATDGTIIRRRIMAVETLPTGEEQLTLDSGLPMDISASTLNRCAWLELCRLDSDAIDLKWWGHDCVDATLPIVVLP